VVFEGEIIRAEELNKRIAMLTGQQNFIYFRDQSKYDRIFSDFAELYACELSEDRGS
jgi:hypothetical protein